MRSSRSATPTGAPTRGTSDAAMKPLLQVSASDVPALTRALATGTPLLLALTPARSAPTPVALDAVPIALRDIEVPSGCAADYDAWLRGGAA